jgi:multiple sugar transport system permease protein
MKGFCDMTQVTASIKGVWVRIGHTMRLNNQRREVFLAFAFLFPMLVLLLTLRAYPVARAFALTLTNKRAGFPAEFVGLDNYITIFTDPGFYEVVVNSLIYTGVTVVGRLVLGMIMALVLNEGIKLRGFFRGWLLIPWVTPIVVGALTWVWILQERGLLNYILRDVLHLIALPIPWLARPSTAMISVIIAAIWEGTPFFGISFLAGMQGIPDDLYAAASVDGASAWQKFRHITLPSLNTVMIVTVTLSTIWVLNGFARIWLMTGGGPSHSTDIVVTYAYKVGLKAGQLGYGAAISLIWAPFLLLAVAFVAPYLVGEEGD